MMSVELPDELRAAARVCLAEADPARKCELSHALFARLQQGGLRIDPDAAIAPLAAPGRPERPQLVDVRHLSQRGLGSAAGRAAFLHAIAHIEFNAINLGWDAVSRFDGMPEAFYRDWASVADDEARHFRLLADRLQQMDHAYGDFDAHNGLWDMAERTARSCRERMALVPRVLEARGLDVTPGMIDKLRVLGDTETVAILQVILDEEIGHVAIGSRWFDWCCVRDGVEPQTEFFRLIRLYAHGVLRGPFNREARREAGFSVEELRELERLDPRVAAGARP